MIENLEAGMVLYKNAVKEHLQWSMSDFGETDPQTISQQIITRSVRIGGMGEALGLTEDEVSQINSECKRELMVLRQAL